MLDHDLAASARDKGEYFLDRFSAKLPARVREVRQVGLMIGIELKEKATPYLQALLQRRVFALPAGPTVIRLLPPLVITSDQLDTVVDALHAVLSD
jgi:acetylornithine/LysW-gamma-L-lysine aminotransferase